MSEEDLEWSLELAGIAGQLLVISDTVAELDMPVLSNVLFDRGEQLREMATDSVFQSAALRGMAQALGEEAETVGALGAE